MEMLLYLVQHGEAKSEEQDPERPLAEPGRKAVEKVARHSARVDVRPQAILHSGKLRAQQTAEILATHLKPARAPEKISGLSPKDDPASAHDLVQNATGDTMLVGHLPHLSRLASLLLTGDAAAELICFQMGGIVCLERGAPGSRWTVRSMLPPEIVAE